MAVGGPGVGRSGIYRSAAPQPGTGGPESDRVMACASGTAASDRLLEELGPVQARPHSQPALPPAAAARCRRRGSALLPTPSPRPSPGFQWKKAVPRVQDQDTVGDTAA